MTWKTQQAMQDDAIRTARDERRDEFGCLSFSGIPGPIFCCNQPGDEVFIRQNFQPAYRDLGNRASPPSHMNTSKILQRI